MTTSYETLERYAATTHGFVTTEDLARADLTNAEVATLLEEEKLVQRGYHLYRVQAIPYTHHTQEAEAIYLVNLGLDAYLNAESVLSFHDLALVNPRQINVGTPRLVSYSLPQWIKVTHRILPPEDLTAYEGIPSTTVRRALLDCKPIVMLDRLLDAVFQAEPRGLITAEEAIELNEEFGSR